MAYIYSVNFLIEPSQISQLEIGAPLERTLGYLRTLLPSSDGYISARAMYSLDDPEHIHVVFESAWVSWANLEMHRNSGLAENKVLVEFEPHVTLEMLSSRVYEEVS